MDRIRGVAIVAMAGLALVAVASFLLWKHGGELKNLREVFDRDGDGVVTKADLPRDGVPGNDGAPGKDCDPQECATAVFADAHFCEAVEACNAKTASVAPAKAKAPAKVKRAPKVAKARAKAKPVAPPPTRAAVTITTEATPGDGTVHLNRATAETPAGFRYRMTVETAVVR